MRLPLLCVIALGWLLGITDFASACPLPLPTRVLLIGGESLHVEVAATPEARACGLSHRKALDPERGMLFVYSTPRPLEFWMKDTHVPLSIAFIDEQGTVLNIQRMTPMQTKERYRSIEPAKYALEAVRGWFSLHGITPGDKVVFQP